MIMLAFSSCFRQFIHIKDNAELIKESSANFLDQTDQCMMLKKRPPPVRRSFSDSSAVLVTGELLNIYLFNLLLRFFGLWNRRMILLLNEPYDLSIR